MLYNDHLRWSLTTTNERKEALVKMKLVHVLRYKAHLTDPYHTLYRWLF